MSHDYAFGDIGLKDGKRDVEAAVYWFNQAENNEKFADRRYIYIGEMESTAYWIANAYVSAIRVEKSIKKSANWWRDYKYEDLRRALYWYSLAKEYEKENGHKSILNIKSAADNVLAAIDNWEAYYKKKKLAKPELQDLPTRQPRKTVDEKIEERIGKAKAGDPESQAL